MCILKWNATDYQKDLAFIPVSIINDLNISNQSSLLAENKSLKTETFYQTILLVIFGVISAIMLFWYWYTEHYEPGTEEG